MERRRVLAGFGGGFTVWAVGSTEARGQGRATHNPGPLRHAHAHNDFAHPRPLHDALSHRFTSVEADVHLVDGELLVAHDPVDLDPSRTLDALYLAPLAARVRAHHGTVYRGSRLSLQLLADLKTEGVSAYHALDRRLRAYPGLLSSYRAGQVRRGPVTVVVSGDRAAREPMAAQRVRYAFHDGRLTDLGPAVRPSLVPLISDNWGRHFTWRGAGPVPPTERETLRRVTAEARSRGLRVRFWATPDAPGPQREAVWDELLAAGVDHLNTDDLAGLAAYLDARHHRRG
ncbi:phosphatidylinositol-specific phospholipase C/glycerophosphodiester phosphodiesterase family protein [Streptomyces uncialis]|uniref:phosphatidylinositol-specific phospholipase C/glycerophosphodiester phosphodiesterase family protein n=1 Tax=Streptomyces uncialis TaxID=1048205 RepID=UPI00365C49CE